MINFVNSLLFHIFFLVLSLVRLQRDVKLSPLRYFNQSLLHDSQKYAAESDYIFFARNILQNVSLQQQIDIAMRKVTGSIECM